MLTQSHFGTIVYQGAIDLTPKNCATHNLRNGRGSRMVGGLLFGFWVTLTNQI